MKGKKELAADLKKKRIIAMLAPSFVAEFDYPYIIRELREMGFDKIVELTFGAKMINREYHKQLEKTGFLVSSVCPGIVEMIRKEFPQLEKNLARIDSPMIATAKICRESFPKHKICFIAPCGFKIKEAEERGKKLIDYVIGYQELWEIIRACKLACHKKGGKKGIFDKFYNDYTKVYPLSGGLSKTAHLKQVLKQGEERIVDGWKDVEKFLKNRDRKVKFLDCTFCKGGCIGGPFLKRFSLKERRKRVLDYMKRAAEESIPESRKGLIEKAKKISFSW